VPLDHPVPDAPSFVVAGLAPGDDASADDAPESRRVCRIGDHVFSSAWVLDADDVPTVTPIEEAADVAETGQTCHPAPVAVIRRT
jgi:hypothetical protein